MDSLAEVQVEAKDAVTRGEPYSLVSNSFLFLTNCVLLLPGFAGSPHKLM